jgi:TRAP-type C4-dicarboxylate transport system substrate-binding protein
MKKLMILLAVACLVCVSCGPRAEKVTDVQEETCCTLTPEQEEMFANWELWADLEEEQQVALVGEMKAFIDDCKAKCEAKCEEKCKKEGEEAEEVCPEKAAKCAEFKAKWEDFENLTLEEQKAILDQVLECHKAKCCKDKEEACTHDHEGCDKE